MEAANDGPGTTGNSQPAAKKRGWFNEIFLAARVLCGGWKISISAHPFALSLAGATVSGPVVIWGSVAGLAGLGLLAIYIWADDRSSERVWRFLGRCFGDRESLTSQPAEVQVPVPAVPEPEAGQAAAERAVPARPLNPAATHRNRSATRPRRGPSGPRISSVPRHRTAPQGRPPRKATPRRAARPGPRR